MKTRAQDIDDLQKLRFPDDFNNESELEYEVRKIRNETVLWYGQKASKDMAKRSEYQYLLALIVGKNKSHD